MSAEDFDEPSQKTVPQGIRAFLDSNDFEDAICAAISLGGDSDTLPGYRFDFYFGSIVSQRY